MFRWKAKKNLKKQCAQDSFTSTKKIKVSKSKPKDNLKKQCAQDSFVDK